VFVFSSGYPKLRRCGRKITSWKPDLVYKVICAFGWCLGRGELCFWTTLSVPTPIVPTPTQDSELSEQEPRDAVRNNGKPTTSVATSIIRMQIQESESNEGPSDAMTPLQHLEAKPA
jgi:hypothetical protein